MNRLQVVGHKIYDNLSRIIEERVLAKSIIMCYTYDNPQKSFYFVGGKTMKFLIRLSCILLVCLSLSSCNMDFWLHYYLPIPKETFETDDISLFLDGSYKEYNGGEDAAAFFDKYVKIDKYKDIDFHYSYQERALATNVGILYDASAFVVDVYYEENDFWDIVGQLAPYTDNAGNLEYEILNSVTPFYDTIITDNSLNQENACSIMFDKQHYTIRYAFIYGYYTNHFRGEAFPYVRGEDDHKITAVLELLLKIKWNSPNYHYIEGEGLNEIESPEDWIFDYSDIIDIETSNETASGSSN